MTSSRSGLVDTKAAGQPINSSMRRTYLIAFAGRSFELRAPRAEERFGVIGGQGDSRGGSVEGGADLGAVCGSRGFEQSHRSSLAPRAVDGLRDRCRSVSKTLCERREPLAD